MHVKYKRILIKLSGEALAGNKKFGLDYETITDICEKIKEIADMGIEIAIVVGGGNFWRGRSNTNMDRTKSDHIGMLGTTMNALAISDVLSNLGLDVRVQTAISMPSIAEPYIKDKAVKHLEKGRIVIFGCGTGSPFFSTDTTASLRAAEIKADIIFKATMVDGVYDKDPNKYSDAKKYDELTFKDVLSQGLEVMDLTAITMCKDNKIKILVFNLNMSNNIVLAAKGETIGTIIKED